MRTAEVDLNTNLTIRCNDEERYQFKMRCIENRRKMAEVLREMMRDYTKRHEKK